MRHRPFLTAAGLLCAVALLAGCGSSKHEATPAPSSGTTTVTAPSTTTTTTADPLAGAGTDPVSGTATASDTALLERVAIGHHDGFDRVVFQFRGGALPGYRVQYVQPPLAEDGSGNRVTVAGDAFVVVRMEPASGFDLNTGEGQLVYKGPRRIEGSSVGASVVRELVRTGDFEAVLSWAVGLGQKVGFRVTTADAPARLIVDFRDH